MGDIILDKVKKELLIRELPQVVRQQLVEVMKRTDKFFDRKGNLKVNS